MKKIEVDIESLLNLVSSDNRNSFNLFYNIYYEQVFRFAYYFVKNKEACREVVSDVFFSVWQARKKLSDIINIEAYLYVVTRNEANRYLKTIRTSNSVSLEEIPIHWEEQADESPEECLLNKEIETLLTQVINELPEKCRIIFLMARQEGMKSKEIAQVLSINESTVRVQMKIAIDKIIIAIKPHFPDLTLPLLFIWLSNLRF